MRDMQTVINRLLDIAGPHLSRDELMNMAGLSEYAEMQSRYLRTLTEGLGCLVRDDTDTGQFQDKESVALLLWHISATADQIAAWIDLSHRADCLLMAMPFREQREAGVFSAPKGPQP